LLKKVQCRANAALEILRDAFPSPVVDMLCFLYLSDVIISTKKLVLKQGDFVSDIPSKIH
jgi:hypothetical protein